MKHHCHFYSECVVVAGKGVECTVSDGSHSSSVRFGSLDYIHETLPSSQAPRLHSLVSGLRESSVVSVLVKSPTEEQHSSSPDSSTLLRCGRPYKRHDSGSFSRILLQLVHRTKSKQALSVCENLATLGWPDLHALSFLYLTRPSAHHDSGTFSSSPQGRNTLPDNAPERGHPLSAVV